MGKKNDTKRQLLPVMVGLLSFAVCSGGFLAANVRPVKTYSVQTIRHDVTSEPDRPPPADEPDSKPYDAYERGWPWSWKVQFSTDGTSPSWDQEGPVDLVSILRNFFVGIIASSVLAIWLARYSSRKYAAAKQHHDNAGRETHALP